MSVVLMSKRELNRLDDLVRLDSDKLTVTAELKVTDQGLFRGGLQPSMWQDFHRDPSPLRESAASPTKEDVC